MRVMNLEDLRDFDLKFKNLIDELEQVDSTLQYIAFMLHLRMQLEERIDCAVDLLKQEIAH